MNLSQLDLKEMYDWPLGMQMFMWALLFAIVFMFGYLFDLGPMRNEIVSSKAYETDLKNNYIKTLQEQVKAHGEINLIPQLTQQLKKWQVQLTPSAEMPVLLDTLLKMGRDSGLRFNEFSPGSEVRAASIVKIPVTVRLSGTYDQIGTFLSKVASFTSLIAITNLVLVKPENLENNSQAAPAESTAALQASNGGSKSTVQNVATPDSSNDILNAELTLEIYKR